MKRNKNRKKAKYTTNIDKNKSLNHKQDPEITWFEKVRIFFDKYLIIHPK